MSVTDDIKSRLDLVDVVSEGVALRRSGRSYTGFCPFHSNTRTPAFVVFPDTQTWRCFGECATGGDLFDYVMKREGYDFKEALKVLAERAGVPLEEPVHRCEPLPHRFPVRQELVRGHQVRRLESATQVRTSDIHSDRGW